MAISLEQLLKEIDDLDIYKKDYDVILDLLNSDDDSFFAKALEEVLTGNLYWSDFEKVLGNTNYPNILEKHLKSQKEINDELKKLISFRESKSLNKDYYYHNKNESLALVEMDIDGTEDIFYKEEMKSIRNNLLYELTKYNENDNILIRACKIRLYNAIKNGKYYLKLKENKSDELNKYDITDTEISYGPVYFKKVESINQNQLWLCYEFFNSKEEWENYKEINDITQSEDDIFFIEDSKDPNYQYQEKENSDEKGALLAPTMQISTPALFGELILNPNIEDLNLGKYFEKIQDITDNSFYYEMIKDKEILYIKVENPNQNEFNNKYYYKKNDDWTYTFIDGTEIFDETQEYYKLGKEYYTLIRPLYEAYQHKYEYINPDDIFFFINTYTIPIDARYQVLDEFDNLYMEQNGIRRGYYETN